METFLVQLGAATAGFLCIGLVVWLCIKSPAFAWLAELMLVSLFCFGAPALLVIGAWASYGSKGEYMGMAAASILGLAFTAPVVRIGLRKMRVHAKDWRHSKSWWERKR